MTTTPTVYQAAFIEGTAYFGGQPVSRLRKLAQGKVKNVSRLPKTALVAELAKLNAQDAERKSVNAVADDATTGGTSVNSIAKPTAKPTKTKTQTRTQAKPVKATSDHETAAKKTSRKMCQVCSKRPVDRKTQGRDSTMCLPCFEYAGWENTHSDNGHDMTIEGTESDEQVAEKAECPVCQGNDPANDVVKTKANGSKAGRTVSKPMAVASRSFDAKAKAFATIAKAAGWKAHTHKVSETSCQVIATLGTETVSMVWENSAYQYDLSEHKDTKGRKAKIRNASAARKIVEG